MDDDRNNAFVDDASNTSKHDEESEVQAFVGEKWAYFSKKWNAAGSGFNIGAAFFNVLWLVYRKMYKYAILTFLGLGVLTAITWNVPDVVDRAINVAIFVTFGMLGNKIYRQWFLAVKEASKDMSKFERLDFLQRRGGTNLGAAILASLLYIGIIVAIVVLAFMAEGKV
ncbi:MAG: DUF2628 domain-containing protein [Proteobacteria bacterium]|nr:DUF2628 domain-containing protein [Pseudomonadota bacterium]